MFFPAAAAATRDLTTSSKQFHKPHSTASDKIIHIKLGVIGH
jgi:hypothetical protein